MKKAFGKCVYDTDNASPVFHNISGCFGDPAGYEEILYKNDRGNCFLWGKGGVDSPYPEEKIVRMSKEKAELWLEAHKG